MTEPYLEVVKLRTSAPTVTQSGRKRDESAGQCMELYGMLLYGRSLLSGEETGIHVEVSYYFLRNPKDGKESIADFFGKENTKCRITLSEWHGKEADGITEAEQMDARFAPQFQTFAAGEKLQEEKSCTYCEWCTVCQYNHAIKPMETVKTISTSKGLQLTTQQQEAIAFRKGIARINAGAGAGKTLVTAMRVARLLLEGIAPGEICLLTFTRTGAEEMRQRVLQYAREMGYRQNLEDLVSTTFNGFGNEIITRNYWLFGFTEPPRLLDEMERSLILTELLDQNPVEGLDYRNFSLNLPAVKGAFAVTAKAFDLFKCKRYRQQDRHTLCADLQKDGISLAAGTVETHTLCADLQKDGISLEPKAAEALFQLFLQYEEILKSRNLIEYADQEILILDLLEREPEYFHDCGFKHLIVDEFQDTNLQQLEIVRHLIQNPDFTSLMVVGDDSQSIFSFRGADYRVMLQFPDLINRPVTDFYLLENHRSTPEILGFANQVNRRNQNRVEKDLLPVRTSGSEVTVRSFEDKETELQWIITRMQNRHQAGIPWEDMAYIAYTRAELLQMRAVCTEAGIPCSLYNPEPLIDNSRVQGALSLIHFLQDPTSTQDAFIYLNAVSRNQLLEKTEEEMQEEILKLQETAEKFMESQDVNLLKAMLEALNEEDELYEQFLQILLSKETTKEIITYAMVCARYGEHLAFKRQKTYPGIVLTTAHSSKGMEWPVVFNSISQYHQKDLEEEELEERRRLFFVSVTRARDELYITGQTVAYGSRENRVYNRFLQESFEILGQRLDREAEPTEKTQGTDARFWEKAC